ncbi:uncharacterized protein BCR38DRAFT_435285 [Pseudomassariella vexata]|uniref:NmrA-like domain-containing protein n=1 Tax=Pseudomassariella vexata TaxID=1141098 RepID=A0A1Y2DYX1_9PEZI|nr:uncharacterized protein BCR38DRAFT_435285 [Pseudomassariella vexata]ORY64492.1 hypothetical protein BCR38DRAFT_435285 [Pseudomassariella vexata]
MAARTFLIVGATGQQGSSVLSALSKLLSLSSFSSSPAPKILALTRSAKSAKAQTLTTKYPQLNITVVEGDVKDPTPIFEAHPGINSVFAYTKPPNEEPQAIPLIDAAAAAGLSQIVFSSVERGGDKRSWDNPTDVPHFLQKHNIELHLKQKAEQSHGKLDWTILRPTAFFDNLNPGTFGKVFASLWATMPETTKLQLVSCRDIGLFAAKALLEPEKWSGRAVGLAGDEMTLGEARNIYRRVVGRELPEAWGPVGQGVRWAIGDLSKMFNFFEKNGYGVDIKNLREEESELQDFETWLKQSSKHEVRED